MDIKILAALSGGNTYIDIEESGLEVNISDTGGNGCPGSPLVRKIRITNPGNDIWQGVIHVECLFDKKAPSFYMPGFMYGSNRGDAPLEVDAKFPRIREGYMNKPASPWWMVRSDRLSHPSVWVYDSGKMYGIVASPYYIRLNEEDDKCREDEIVPEDRAEHNGITAKNNIVDNTEINNADKDTEIVQWHPGMQGEFVQYCGYTCSIDEGYIGYTVGYENAPWFFLQSHNVYDREVIGDNAYTIGAGDSLDIELALYEYDAEDKTELYNAVKCVYNMYHEPPRMASDRHSTIVDIASAISRDAWIDGEKAYSGFVFESEDGSFTYNKLPSISWTNGMAVALPMLLSSYRVNDDIMRKQALIFIQNMVDNSINPKSGLPFDSCNDGVWSNRGWWYERLRTPGHSSYLAGQALFYLCKAYEYEKNVKGIVHSDWIDYVENVVKKIAITRNTDNEYPYILSDKTGAGIEYDSFAGAWCLAAIAYYEVLTDDTTYLNDLRESEQHYYTAYIREVSCYGAPLDTDKAVDSEGVLAYIRAMRLLHIMTGENVYLDHMKAALDYEFTFKFCYNSPVKVPPLSHVGWSSCGGSITSVANPHIHPMSSTVADEMLYYLNCRNDEYIKSRLNDVLLWGCQTYNTYDKEYDYGLKGWMSERFCHSEGLLTERYPDGSPASTWFALMPWAAGCILESLAGKCYEI